MYIIIVGTSNVAKHLIKLLDAEDHEVVLIEKDPVITKQMTYDTDIVTITGDPTDVGILKKAGFDHADIIVALTDNDELNLVVGLIAKEYGIKKVAVMLRKINYKNDVFDKLKIDYVIQPDYAAAGFIAQLIAEKGILDMSFFSMGDAEIVEFKIKKDTKHVGLHIPQFRKLLPDGSNIIGYYKNKVFNVYKDTDTLQEGQKIIIVSKREKIKKVKALF